MKRFFVAIVATFCLLSAKSYADEIVNIPDSAFKAQLVNHQNLNLEAKRIDLNNDGEIQYSEAEVFSSKLWLSGTALMDLTGIQEFKSLHTLSLGAIGAKEIDLSGMPTLGWLHAERCSTEVLNLSNCSNFRDINCWYGELKHINLTACGKVTDIYAYPSRFDELNVSDCTNLENLHFGASETFAQLDLSNNLKLKGFGLVNSNLSEIDLSHNINLRGFSLNDNNLNVLNLRNGNNAHLNVAITTGNPDLKCISVDDPEWSEANWRNNSSDNISIDDFTEFSEDCSSNVKDEDISFKIYPNPANSQITIERETIKQADLRILNMKGQICLSQTIEHGQTQAQIDISKLSNGSYIVEIDNETTTLLISK